MAPLLLAVMGPTGSGKSDLAEAMADEYDALLVSADAFQIYRGFDIGTNKPTDRERYSLIDIRDPEESFGVGEYVRLALGVLEPAFRAGRNVVVVGGTGFYIRALVESYDDLQGPPNPELRQELERREREEGKEVLAAELSQLAPEVAVRTDLNNPVRIRRALERILDPSPRIPVQLPPFRTIKVGLDPDRDQLKQQLDARTSKMVQNGWVREVKEILARGVGMNAPAMRAIGYRALAEGILGGTPLERVLDIVRNETVQYAKRQRTWLQSEPRLLRLTAFGGDALATTREAIQNAMN